MKTSVQRIRNIIGQLEGVSRMIESDAECNDVIIQMKAVRSAIGSLSSSYISQYLKSCLNDGDEEKVQKLISDLI